MNKHEPAFPAITIKQEGDSAYNPPTRYYHPGLTKYEEVAAKFMAALMSNENLAETEPENGKTIHENLAAIAFDSASAFFTELEKRGAK